MRYVANVAKQISRLSLVYDAINVFQEHAEWLKAHTEALRAERDPPKSLEELQNDVADPKPGYEIHHIVEEAAARREGFPEELINSPDNLVRIPVLRHYSITGWSMTLNQDFNDLSPRDYLNGKSWEEKRRVGLFALQKFGALEP